MIPQRLRANLWGYNKTELGIKLGDQTFQLGTSVYPNFYGLLRHPERLGGYQDRHFNADQLIYQNERLHSQSWTIFNMLGSSQACSTWTRCP